MHALVRKHSLTFQCIENSTYDDFDRAGETVGCGVPFVGEFFFVSYILVVTLIFLNLFIAIILEAFSKTSKET